MGNPQDFESDDYPPALNAVSTNVSNNVFVQNRTSDYMNRANQIRAAIDWKSYSKASFHHNVVAIFQPTSGEASSPFWYKGAACMQHDKIRSNCTNVFEDNFNSEYFGS